MIGTELKAMGSIFLTLVVDTIKGKSIKTKFLLYFVEKTIF